MITGWQVIKDNQVVFTNISVLACFDYCVANGLSTKLTFPVYENNIKYGKLIKFPNDTHEDVQQSYAIEAYEQILNDNGLDTEKYIISYKTGYDSDDVINGNKSILVKAIEL